MGKVNSVEQSSIPTNPSLVNLLSMQNRIAEHDALCKQLRVTILEREKHLTNLENVASELPSLSAQREDLLAAIAIGKGNEAELASLDTKIDAERQLLDDHHANSADAISETAATLTGLRRKLSDVEKEQLPLQHARRQAIVDYIKSEAERVGADYISLAHDLTAIFRQLMALCNIYDKFREHESPIYSGQEFQYISIPAFKLQSHQGHENNLSWLMDDTVNLQNRFGELFVRADIATEMERIKTMGVEL